MANIGLSAVEELQEAYGKQLEKNIYFKFNNNNTTTEGVSMNYSWKRKPTNLQV